MLAPPQSVVNESIAELAEEVRQFSYHRKKIDKHNKTKRIADVNLSELLNMEVLANIRAAFVKNGDTETGEESLSATEFIDTLSQYLPRAEIERLYQKIDVNDDGNVDWQEFTGFLTTSEAGVGTVARSLNQVFTLKAEQDFDSSNHHDMIDHIKFSARPFPCLVSAGRDGQIHVWSQGDLKQIGSISHPDKNSIFLTTLRKSMSIEQKAMVAKSVNKNPVTTASKKMNYITALALMPVSGHICISSGDSCVSVHELAGQELCGRIPNFTDLPTALEAFLIVDKIRDTENQCLAIGDAKGNLHIVNFDPEFGISSDGGLKKQNQILMTKAVEKMRSLRVHSDWITCLLYVNDLNRLLVGSLDGMVTLFNAQKCTVDRVFEGTGVSVRLMAWSSNVRNLVSACTDRSLVVWDPYTLQVATKIDGLTAYVIGLYINDDAQQIIVTMSDKTIRTWDCVTFEALHVVHDTSTQLPLNTLSASLWVPSLNVLYTAGSRISAWLLERTSDSWYVTDDDDLCTTLFNSVFNQVLTITYGGVVSVYSIVDGSIASKFHITPSVKSQVEKSTAGRSGRKLPVISTASFDISQRRLMVVTAQNTEIQLWNFHNGQCVKTIHPRIPNTLYSIAPTSTTSAPDFKPYEITSLAYFIVYQGPARALKKFVTFGTDIGITSCLLESSEDIEDEPSYNLMKSTVTGRKKVFLESSSTADDGDLRKSRAVQWMIPSCENHVLVAYRDGSMLHWDIDKSIPGAEIEPRRKDAGVSFVALKRRVVASRGHALAFNEKLRKNSVENSSPSPFDDEEFDSSQDDVKQSNLQFPDIPRTRVKTPDIRRPSSSTTNRKSSNVAGRRENSMVGGMALSPRGSVSMQSPRKLSVMYSQHRPSRVEKMEDSIPTVNSVIRSSMASAVVGTAKSIGFGKSSLKPLFDGDEEESSFTLAGSSRLGKGSRIGKVSFANPHHMSVVESDQPESEGEEEVEERERATDARRLEEPLDGNSLDDIGDLGVTAEPMLRVHSAVILKMTRIIIGSCNDGLIRFWDLDNGKILCSCMADPNAVATIASASVGAVGSPLMCLKTNAAQDLLVGGFESGEVKVWLISHQSLISLRKPSYDSSGGMSIPALQLLAEWNAHDSCVLNIGIIELDENEFGHHDNYLMTCSHDQDTHLWTISGEKVGTHGVTLWDINNKMTWSSQKNEAPVLFQDSNNVVTRNAIPPPPASPRKSQHHNRQVRQKNLPTRPAEDIAKEDHIRTIKLQIHMEKIQAKNSRPHVTCTSSHNEVYSSTSHKHPVIDVTKQGYAARQFRKMGSRGGSTNPATPKTTTFAAMSPSRRRSISTTIQNRKKSTGS